MENQWIKKYILCFLILGLCCVLSGQTSEYVAEKFTKDHGLPDNYIKDLDIDSDGNIWIITRKGLVKFDGFSFETVPIESVLDFKELEIDVHDNLWLKLVIDEKNELIKDKIIIYNTESQKTFKLRNYCEIGDFDNSKTVHLWKDQLNNILISYRRYGVYMYEGSELKKVTQGRDDLIPNFKNRAPYLIIEVNKKRDAIVTTDLRTKRTKVIKDKDVNFYIWNNDKIQFKSYFSLSWKNTLKKGVVPRINLISIANDTLIKNAKNLLHYAFNNNDFYFISDDQLNVYNLESRQTINLNEELSPILSNLDLLKIRIFNDKIWIATNEGIIKVEQKKNIFQGLLNDDNLSIREMLSISKDSLLVNSESGVYLLDINNNKILQRIDAESEFYGLTKIDNKRYLLGMFGYRNKVLDLDSSIISWFPNFIKKDNKAINRGDVFLNSYLDKNDKLWITSNRGIGIYNIEVDEFIYMFQDEIGSIFSTDIVPGPKGNYMFLLSDNGMFQIDVDLLRIKKIYEFENQVVSHVSQDKDDDSIYWVGTRYDGLVKWKYDVGIIDRIKKEDGLGNNNVHSVFEDNHGRLWLSTDYGISVYNKSTREISVITEENGIHENEMNRHSYCFVNDSLIVYGGLNGIIKFNPYDVILEDNNKELDVKYLKYVDNSNNKNKVVNIDKDIKELVLKKNQMNPKLIFDIPQNSFSNTLRYIISSAGSEWSYTQGNSIDLSILEEGTSNLFVSKKIGINEWSSPKTITIFRAPPFYRAYWFYGILVSVFSFGIFLYVNHRRVRALKMNRRISREVEIKTKELYYKNKSLSESKRLNDQLFAIIGHDLRSPLISLNNISKSINYLSEKGQYNEVKKLTKTVESNSKKSLAIIDRLIEWTERQKDSMLEFHKVNISNCLNKSIYEHEEFAHKKGIKFRIMGKKWISCISNEASLLIVLGNLISNAIKFSNNKEEISIRYYRSNAEIVIEIKDQGSGMTEERLKKINSFNPVASAKSPGGEIGLGMGILMSSDITKKINGKLHFTSELSKGTTAYLTLPN